MGGKRGNKTQKEDRDTDMCMLHTTPITHLGQYEKWEKIRESLHNKITM